MHLLFALALSCFAADTQAPADETAELNELQRTLEARVREDEKQADVAAAILRRTIASEPREE